MKKLLSIVLALLMSFSSASALVGCTTPEDPGNGEQGQTNVKVTFKNGTTTVSQPEIAKGGKVSAPATNPTKTGYNFSHWSTSENGTAYDFNSTVSADLTLYAVFTIASYNVGFYDDAGNALGDYATIVEYGSTVTEPTTDPTKAGYTFSHWSTAQGGAAYDFSTPVSGNLILYAVFVEAGATTEYTVSFKVDGATTSTANVEAGSTVSAPANPSKTGYTFLYWSATENGATAYDFSAPVNANLTLYAVFEEEGASNNEHTVIFVADGATVNTVEVLTGNTVSAPATNPEKAGYNFVHWSLTEGGAAYNFATPVTGALTLYAVFEEAVQKTTVIFMGATGVHYTNSNVVIGSTVSAPAAPTKAADASFTYTFSHWSTTQNGAAYNFATPVTGALTLYAVFTATPIGSETPDEDVVTIKFYKEDVEENYNDDGELETFFVAEAEYGDLISPPSATPVKLMDDNFTYAFDGWYSYMTDEKWDFEEGVVSDDYIEDYGDGLEMGFYPVFIPTARKLTTITFTDDNGNVLAQFQMKSGTSIQGFIDDELANTAGYAVPSHPEKADSNEGEKTYMFIADGWKVGADYWTLSNSIVTDSITLKANYQKVVRPSSEFTEIRLGGWTPDYTMREAYLNMIEEFNTNFGPANQIAAVFAPASAFADYQSAAQTQLDAKNDPYDVYMTNDRTFKTWVQSYGEKLMNLGSRGLGYTSAATYETQLDGMWSGMINRFRLDTNGWTSYEDDDLWVVPVDSNPTALYYNRTVLESNGIIVISVEDMKVTEDNYDSLVERAATMAEATPAGQPVGYYNGIQNLDKDEVVGKYLLDLWNDNLIEDMFGSYHDELIFANGEDYIYDYYGYNQIGYDELFWNDIRVPAKGFYRSSFPRDTRVSRDFRSPATGEFLIFNASIAMSWDETEDIAMLCTKLSQYNNRSRSTYGFYSQWWFAYGWTVGGDCIEDMTGDGAWAFSLSDYTNNYVVREEACTEANPNDPSDTNRYYIGEWTGTLYSAGDTLAWLDKMDVNKLTYQLGQSVSGGDIIVPADDGGFYKYNAADPNATQQRLGRSLNALNVAKETSDNTGIRANIRDYASTDMNDDGKKFVEIPSTKEAFTKWANLCPGADANALSVSYVSGTATDEVADVNYLGEGMCAFVIERGDKLGAMRKAVASNGNSWGVANTPIFKEYKIDPSTGKIDPSKADVQRIGVQAGHSECVALGISAGCPVEERDAAWQFIQWMTSDVYYIDSNGNTYFGEKKNPDDTVMPAGQTIKAQNGFIPNQATLFEATEAGDKSFIKAGEQNLNLHLFAYAIEYEGAGDWWYLPNGSATWINKWASTLNASNGVRGGNMLIADWFSASIKPTNQELHTANFNYYYNIADIESKWDIAVGATRG